MSAIGIETESRIGALTKRQNISVRVIVLISSMLGEDKNDAIITINVTTLRDATNYFLFSLYSVLTVLLK